jgi:hypothetical protein
MKTNWIYRGIKKGELPKLKEKGIFPGTVFTTDPFIANQHGKVIAVNYSKQGFKQSSDNSIFRRLKLKERYFVNLKPIKNFKEVGVLK